MADEPRTVVVLPLGAPSVQEGETVAEAARDLLAEGLANAGGLTLVERERLDAVLAEQRIARAFDGADATRIGGLLGATHAVAGVVSRTERGWRITLEAMRVPDGAVLGSVDVEGVDRDLAGTATKAARDAAALLASGGPVRGLREDPRAAP